MALSPADFAAYSRATGTPYPEDPEERAELAPEVLEFRRNQLQQPKEESNLPGILGAVAAGLGLLGAGAYGARRLAGRPKPQVVQTKLGVNIADLSNAAAAQRQSTPAPSRIADPWSGSAAVPTAIPQSTVDLTTIQQSQKPNITTQQIEAVDTGLDQVAARANVVPKQRQVNGFTVFSQKAEEITAQAAAQRAAMEALSVQKSKAPKNARELQALGPQYGLTQEEIFHRITASAADYKPGSMQRLSELDYAALLDPSVPTDNVKDLLGTTLAVRGGRVGRNLDYEVMAEGGGMTQRTNDVDLVGEFGSDVYAYNPRTGNYEIDTTADLEDVNLTSGRTSDYESNAADYGDVEGPGGFVLTKGFTELTKGGSTTVPGSVVEAEGMAPGSSRQEREIDRVLPARETLEGDPATGWTFDPRTGRAYLVGTGVRTQETRTNVAGNPIRVVQAATAAKRKASTDSSLLVSTGAGGRSRELGAYQGRIQVDDPSYDPTSGGKLTGRYQPATAEPSALITTQPVTGYMSAQERLIQDEQGNWYVNQAKTKVTGEQPLRALVGSDPNPRDISLNRNELTGVLNNAAERWSSEGGGNPLERQTFLIQALDGYLKTSKRITLPVLQPNEKGYLSSAAFDFINNVLPGIKETNIYVKPAKINAEGRPLVQRKTFGPGNVRETPIVDPAYIDMEAVPLPGKTKVSGAGGVAVQDVDTETYEGATSFFSPRIETAPQRVLPMAGRPPAEEAGSVISRPYLETAPVGYRVKSPGSFARTQNPYTGAAAAAMGPASRASAGDYQYPSEQLKVNLEPTSQRQLQERNQFALTANLTPGGRVKKGALNLGGGLGTIETGVGSLSETETIKRYGVTGQQLSDFGNQLMYQAAQRRGVTPGPTAISTYIPEVQLELRQPQSRAPVTSPGVTRVSQTEADIDAQRTAAYLARLQRGRSTPLTSEAVIQPRLF